MLSGEQSGRAMSALRMPLLFVLGLVRLANGQHVDEAHSGRKCGEYRLARVAYLLGCCGDLEVNYPGNRFPHLSAVDRATRALAEIELATKAPCAPVGLEARIDLALNRIGAYAMRASARLDAAISAAEVSASHHDADTATRELRRFVRLYPQAANKLWAWVATTFRRAGQPLEALAFLTQVANNCCEHDPSAGARLTAMKADILYDTAVYSSAARLYSEWLSRAEPGDLCGRARSLRNVAELHGRGFGIRGYPVEQKTELICIEESEWEPYVGAPR